MKMFICLSMQKCVIYVKGMINVKGMPNDEMVKSGEMLPGFITAQGRQSEQDTSGFVFKFCTIKGDGTAALGRAYRGYSRVVFYATNMSNVIVPQGWDAWHYKGQEYVCFLSFTMYTMCFCYIFGKRIMMINHGITNK